MILGVDVPGGNGRSCIRLLSGPQSRSLAEFERRALVGNTLPSFFHFLGFFFGQPLFIKTFHGPQVGGGPGPNGIAPPPNFFLEPAPRREDALRYRALEMGRTTLVTISWLRPSEPLFVRRG